MADTSYAQLFWSLRSLQECDRMHSKLSLSCVCTCKQSL